MRKFYLLTLLAFLPLLANADAVEIDGIYYNLNAETNTAEVTVKPGNSSFGSNYSGDIVIPEAVTYNEASYSVTSIGVDAFSNCSVTSVVIPNSVKSIGFQAFYASRILSVTIGSAVSSIDNQAFMACNGLTSITIPKSVTSIGEMVFGSCNALSSIVVESGNPNYDSRNDCNALIETANNTLIIGCKNTIIPDGIKVIARGAFWSCSSLTSITIPNSVTSIGNSAFIGCSGLTSVTIPNSVISIGGDAFFNCGGLKSLTLGNGLTTIGECAFEYCRSLTSITIPASVSSIGRSILGGCLGLETIQVENGNAKYDSRDNCNAIIETASNTLMMGCNHTVIPNSITSIESGAFGGCTGLTSVTIASGITSIGGGAFSGCSGLTSIVVEDGNTVYDSRNNCNALIETATGLLVAGCNNSVIPDGVKTIGAGAFSGCKGLTSIMIPNSVTTIGHGAFKGSGLTSVTIPNSVTSIGENVFFECFYLASVTIGNRISSIGSNAFQECCNLTSVTIPNSVTYIGVVAFNGCSLSSISLGSGITNIDRLAFLNVPLKDVYCSAKEVPEVSSQAFGFSSSINATLHVPAGSVDAYKATSPWSGFKEVKAIETKKTINVETAGTLATLIPETEKYLIEDLTLTGNLNGLDLRLLRDMAGSDYNGFPTDGKLSFLDMSGATIVAGGKYVELVDENIYYNREIGNFHGGFDKDPQVSEANTLGKNVFAGCSKLETMIMPTGVVTVGERAFSDTSLKDIVWPTSLATIGYEAFFGCKFTSFTLPASVEGIGGNIVESCGSLIELSVESGNTRYDSRDNCNALIEKSTNTLILGCKNSTIPNSVTAIGDFAFSGCSGLTSLFIPSSVTAIGKNAFWRCSGLTSISIGSGVTSIGSGAFASCSNVTTIVVEDGNTAYDSRNNCNAIIEKSTNTLIAGCNNSTIPDGVTVIGDGAFQGCTGITSLVIPNSVTAIGECAFDNCTGLTSVTFSDKLISIGNWSFYGIGVTSLTIPNSVTTIGEQAFYQCRNLTSATIGSGIKKIGWLAFGCLNGNFTDLYCYAEAVPKADETMGSSYMAFDWSINKAILHVPAGSVDAYKATEPWSGFKEVVAIATEKAVNVTTAGTLSTLIADGEKNYIENLTITGNLNGADLRYLREMAGSDYNGVPTDGKLSYLDMSGATIIAGENYVELLDGIIIYDKEIGNYHGGFDKDPQVSEANTLGKYVFAGCSKLETIKLPASVLTIGERAFSDTNLKDIVLPRSLTTIGNEAFFDCKFTSFTLPASVESVGGNILKYCSTLELSVESGNSNYDSRDNCNAIIETSTNTLIGGCKNTIIPNSVTSIGVEAFCGCASGLLSLTIPSSVTSIGYDAFEACSDLVHVYCNAEVVPTTDADAFKNVDIRNRVTLHVPAGSVEAYQAAAPWSGFNKVVALSTNIPDVEIQGVYYNLNEETLTAEVTMNPNKYSGEVSIASGIWYDSRLYSVTSIGVDAFQFCNLLTSVVIPNSVTSIGSYAFYFCEDLSSIMIPNSVTKIFGNPFQGCSSLESILVEEGNTTYDSRNNCNAIIETGSNTLISGCKNTLIPASVTSIGDNAFTEIANLTSISIPASVEYIGSASFSSCSNLESIQVESGNTKYDSRNNCNAIIETASNTLIHGCKNTVIPANVTSIGEMAFDECDGLTSVTIPSAVTFIGISAFEECKDLVSMQVESGNTVYDSRNNCNAIIETASNTLISGCKNTIIPISVTSIGENAFRYCFGLESVTIPCDVTSIGNMAFFNCYQLTDIYCSAENVPTTGYGAFDGINGDNVTLHVPAGSVEAYKAASPWKDFGTICSSVTSLFDGTNLWTSYVAQEDYAIPAGLEAYVISSLTETSAVASQIDYIPQGVPILLKRNDATTNSFDFTIGTGTAPTTNLLKVYDTDKTVSNREGYILYKDEFVLVDEGTLPAGRVFLPLNGGNAAMTRGIVVEGEGTTGIQNLVSDSEISHGVWYDLQGRRIDGKPIKKGVYILNGRKVVVK